VEKCLRLKSYLQSPGDGRTQPRIPARALLWALLMGQFLRRSSFAGIEALVRSSARPALCVSRFGDDALGYFTERLHAALTRRAAATAVRQAKRNKAFDNCRFIGLAWMERGWRARAKKSAGGVVPTGIGRKRSWATTTQCFVSVVGAGCHCLGRGTLRPQR